MEEEWRTVPGTIRGKKMPEKRSIALQLEQIANEICEKYCKYPEQWDEEKEGVSLFESDVCANCPLSKLA